MNAKKWLFYSCIIALAAACFAGPAKADLYWETRSVIRNFPGSPAVNSIQRYYFTPYASRVDLGSGKTIIIHYDTMKLYSLNTRKRTFTRIDLARLGAIPGLPGKDQAQMAHLMGAMLGSQVIPTNRYKTIAGYRCRKYYVRLALVNGEYWISRDVNGYRQMEALGAEADKIAQYNPLVRQMDIAGLIRRLDGFPVCAINHVMGKTVTSTLTKIEQRRLDPSLFDIPQNYVMQKRR